MLLKFWQRITTTRYTRSLVAFAHMECALKDEITRLRAENRALLNSILGISGIPPIVVTPGEAKSEAAMLNALPQTGATNSAACADAPRPSKPESSAPSRVRFKTESDPPHRSSMPHANPPRIGRFSGQPQHNVSPVRRRSWQQINRMLEFESGKKKPQET